MADLDPKAVKSMVSSLQRQRNAAHDRIVDLETVIDARVEEVEELKEALKASYNDNNHLRDAQQKITDLINVYIAVLAEASTLPSGFTVLKNGDMFELVKPISATSSVSSSFDDTEHEQKVKNIGKK